MFQSLISESKELRVLLCFTEFWRKPKENFARVAANGKSLPSFF
jgi:hypothetical protein